MNDPYNLIDRPVVHSNGLFDFKYNVPGMSIYLQKEDLELFPQMQTPAFWCEDFETIYVKTGSLNVIVNGESALIDTGELCFVKPGCVHYLVSDNKKPCTFFLGLINESIFYDSKALKRKYFDPIFHAVNPNFAIYHNTAPNHAKMIALLQRLDECLDSKEPAHELLSIALCHEYLYLIWNELGEDIVREPSSRNDEEIEAFRKILSHIHKNYGEKITIDELCEVGVVSRNQCFNLFKRFVGKSPAKYIMEYRLDCAKTMLQNTDKSITQIALDCGFAHQSHLGRNFAERFGVTPLNCRNNFANLAPKGHKGYFPSVAQR